MHVPRAGFELRLAEEFVLVACAARQLRLVGDAAMLDAIRVTGIGLLSTEVEVGFARMAERPLANAVVEVDIKNAVSINVTA